MTHYARAWSAEVRVPPLGAIVLVADDDATADD